MTDETITDALARNSCPDCGRNAWRLGPCGGISQNIECTICLKRFNVARHLGVVIIAERIESEADGGWIWREDFYPR